MRWDTQQDWVIIRHFLMVLIRLRLNAKTTPRRLLEAHDIQRRSQMHTILQENISHEKL